MMFLMTQFLLLAALAGVLLVDAKDGGLLRRRLGPGVDTPIAPKEELNIAIDEKDGKFWKRLLQNAEGSIPSPRPPTDPPVSPTDAPVSPTAAPVMPTPRSPTDGGQNPAPAVSEPTEAPPTENAPTDSAPAAAPAAGALNSDCQPELLNATQCIVAAVTTGIIPSAAACTSCIDQALQPTDCAVLDTLVCQELSDCDCGTCTFTTVPEYAKCFAQNVRGCGSLSCS